LFKKILKKLWQVLDHKGKIASIQGSLLAFPVNAHLVYSYFSKIELTEAQLLTAVILNGIAVAWFILPSTIEITGKLFSLKIID